MCGIAGSNDLERAFTLYKLNLSRGDHSSGFLAFNQLGHFDVLKTEGIFEKNSLMKYKELYSYFLFHSRAPTNSTQTTWSSERTHPFNYKNYYIAHNGIISNFKEFNKFSCEVDSAIIPRLLEENKGDLTNCYEKLEGLLTSWVFNSKDNSLFLVKAGSSLWIDENSFSSTQFDNSSSVQDGSVYQYNNYFEKVKKFNYTNPYFIL